MTDHRFTSNGRRWRRLSIMALACVALMAPDAEAQTIRRSSSIITPATSRVDPEGALGVELSPAAIAFVRSYAATYMYAGATDASTMPLLGHGFYGVGKLPFGFAMGASVERVKPELEPNYGRFSFALSHAAGSRGATGLAVRRTADGALPGVTSFDFSMVMRPLPVLGLALNVHDLLGESSLTGGAGRVPTTFDLALALRPFGRDAMTLEGGFLVDTDGRVALRAISLFEIPYVGQLNASFTASELADVVDLRGTVGLIARISGLSVGASALIGDGYDKAGHLVIASLTGQAARTWAFGMHVLDVEITERLSARELLALLEKLELARIDPRVGAVLLRLRDSKLELAGAQEVRSSIARLRAAGKPVVCHLAGASGSEHYACAAANETYIDPSGHVRLIGLSVDSIHIKRLLESVGIRADFVRFGDYKSAPEMFTEERMSEASREQRERFLDEAFARWTNDLGEDLGKPVEEVKRLIDQGPYFASDAISLALVNGEGDEFAFTRTLRDSVGRGHLVKKLPPRRDAEWAGGKRVAVIVIDDAIVEGDNVDIPVLDLHQTGAKTVIKAIEAAVGDPRVRAIVLRIDSPGGSAIASDQIWRAVRRAREKKPVVASLGRDAASGGYYIASAASEIFANPATRTGSIGVFFGKADVEALSKKLGVDVETLTRGERAGATSIYRPFTDEEREALRATVEKVYELFLSRVATGRSLDVAAVRAVAEGRVYSGEGALALGLVDQLGGFSRALARARELGGLRQDSAFTFAPRPPSGILGYLLSSGVGASVSDLAPRATETLGLMLPFFMSRQGTILAMPEELFLTD
jgi:protease IV